MIDPDLIVFAIRSGAKLGREVYDLLVDNTQSRALFLPLGDLYQDIETTVAVDFFLRPENASLIARDGPYGGLDALQMRDAYRTLCEIQHRLDLPSGGLDSAKEMVLGLARIEQFKRGEAGVSGTRQLLGVLVEIGIDYFAAHPEALVHHSTAEHVLRAFLKGLTPEHWIRSSFQGIAADLLRSALNVLAEHPRWVTEDLRLQVVLTGVIRCSIGSGSDGEDLIAGQQRLLTWKRIGSGLLRGTVQALEVHPELFLPQGLAHAVDPQDLKSVSALLSGVITSLVDSVEGRGNFLAPTQVEALTEGVLGLIHEHPGVLGGASVLSRYLDELLQAVAPLGRSSELPESNRFPALQSALRVMTRHGHGLVDTHAPAIPATVLRILEETLHACPEGSRVVHRLLSTSQWDRLIHAVLAEVALNPRFWVDTESHLQNDGPLARTFSIAWKSLAEGKVIGWDGTALLEWLRMVLQTTGRHPGFLLEFSTTGSLVVPLEELLSTVFRVFHQETLPSWLDARIQTAWMRIVLEVACSRVKGYRKSPVSVELVLTAVLSLACGELRDRIHGGNCCALVEVLLRRSLKETQENNPGLLHADSISTIIEELP